MNKNASYEFLSKYYDEIMQNTRDYARLTQSLATLINERTKLLEIGVGTGLVVNHLLQINPQYEIWGIDNSESLLEQAKSKFEAFNQVHLCLQDVSTLNLEQDFEVIYSRGGVMFFMAHDREYFLGSHLLNRNDNLNALKRITKHLQVSGLFILSSGRYPSYYADVLKDGIIFHRKSSPHTQNGQKYSMVDFSYTKNDIVNKQSYKIFLMSYEDYQELFAEAGLKPLRISDDGEYHIYQKC